MICLWFDQFVFICYTVDKVQEKKIVSVSNLVIPIDFNGSPVT